MTQSHQSGKLVCSSGKNKRRSPSSPPSSKPPSPCSSTPILTVLVMITFARVLTCAHTYRQPHETIDNFSGSIILECVLSSPLAESNPGVARAFLPEGGSTDQWPPVNTLCTFVGWGCLEKGYGPSAKAQVVALKVMPHWICSAMYQHAAGLNVDHEFCAGFYESNVGICPGDSGSGLIYLDHKKPVVVGVASATHATKPEAFPGLFTRVSSFNDWIKKTIEENN
ncbi:unnamed protein product [Echinostoma caproni]|uniref:Peptidase S1 domain-containing protein n=1 Tax=Echinostoma caproni TaxID=27848 RepID=A0A183AAW5_9TREM|nr:unnamed protein product [Echinostoma caproni]